jgi:hypothetical protein
VVALSSLPLKILIAGPSPAILRQKRKGPMAKRYIVTLSEDERVHLLVLTKKGKVSSRKPTRAHILLQADAGARMRPSPRRSA